MEAEVRAAEVPVAEVPVAVGLATAPVAGAAKEEGFNGRRNIYGSNIDRAF